MVVTKAELIEERNRAMKQKASASSDAEKAEVGERLSLLRQLLSKVEEAEITKKGRAPITSAGMVALLKKERDDRLEAIEQIAVKGGRPDLAAPSQREVDSLT